MTKRVFEVFLYVCIAFGFIERLDSGPLSHLGEHFGGNSLVHARLQLRQAHFSTAKKSNPKSVLQKYISQEYKDLPIPLDILRREKINDLKDFLKQKPNLNLQKANGWTPLMWAAFVGHGEVVKALVDEGAKPDLQNKQGQTALLIAARHGLVDVSKVLIGAKACLNICDDNRWSPLFMSLYWDYFDNAKLLLESGAAPNTMTKQRNYPIDFAKQIPKELLQLLFQNGARLSPKIRYEIKTNFALRWKIFSSMEKTG